MKNATFKVKYVTNEINRHAEERNQWTFWSL